MAVVQTLEDPHVEMRECFQIFESICVRVVMAFGALLCSQLDKDVLRYLNETSVKHTVISAVAVIHVTFLFFTLFASLDRPNKKRVLQMLIIMAFNALISGFIVKLLNHDFAKIVGWAWSIPIILVLGFRYNDVLLQLASIGNSIRHKFFSPNNDPAIAAAA